jgi:hypothetical protein
MPVATAADTVAVNVTFCPKVDGLLLEDTEMVVPAWFTVCEKGDEPLLE